MTMKNGQIYDGMWKDGLPHGEGKEVTVNGDEYVGQFVQGKR